MSNFYFPDDLLRDVLSRLPVKSLLRFKCLSRSWYLIIDSPEFIKMHAKRTETTESSMKIIAGGFLRGDYKHYAVDFNLTESSKANNMEEVNYPNIMYDKNDRITFAGSCNGLLCLVYSQRGTTTTVLWNPSTQKHLTLPICSKQYRKTLTIYDDCVHGFGYDEVTDDYKVVRMVKYRDERFLHISPDFLIYSLKSNEWRSLEDFSCAYDLKWRIDGVLTNGALHWMLQDRSILAFNLGTEGFQRIPPPEASRNSPMCQVRVLGGCLHLIFGNFFCGACEMWVMKNYGIKDSWTKLTLDWLMNRSVWPIAFLKSDKHVIVEAGFCERIVIYAIEEQPFQKVKFPVEVDKVEALIYFESLVRLDAGGSDVSAGTSGKQHEGRKKKKVKGLHLLKKIAITIRRKLKLGTKVN